MHKQLRFGFILFIFINCSFPASATCQIFIASTPKCGTHLLDKVLLFVTGKKSRIIPRSLLVLHQEDINSLSINEIYLSHAVCSHHNQHIIAQHTMRGFYIYRDPRDFIVSSSYWIKKNSPLYAQASVHDLISMHIANCSALLPFPLMPAGGSVVDFYRICYLNWRNNPAVYTTSFEKLVGIRGGGNLSSQLREIKNIARHIGIKINTKKALEVSKNLFGNTYTFREGKIGSWRKHFTHEQKEQFKKINGACDLLIELGYEKNKNW